MKNLPLKVAIGLVLLQARGAAAAELPTFEVFGFPISSHQVAVLGSANVQEQSAVPTLSLGGMPASPHQIAVLTPRAKVADTAWTSMAKAGFSVP